jgi:hypothetical protein
MTERPFERHYGELRCRRYLFDPVYPKDGPELPEPKVQARPASPAPRAPGDVAERPQ